MAIENCKKKNRLFVIHPCIVAEPNRWPSSWANHATVAWVQPQKGTMNKTPDAILTLEFEIPGQHSSEPIRGANNKN